MPDPTRTLTDTNATASVGEHTTAPPLSSPSHAPSPVVTAGRYALGPEIARGGMGEVYRATDAVLHREVAVKVLQPKFPSDSPTARRFHDEARITAQLQHPGIPAVHDLGTLPDGRPFLAMKLIKGDTLDALLKARLTPADDRGRFVAVFEHLAHALAYAHAHGVIHRDLKPANVMVGAFNEVQVMDWGLVKVLVNRGGEPAGGSEDPDATADPDPTAIRSLRDADTQAGSVLGTPAFMAPEQAIGAVDRIDRRTDVFGLGAILAVVLTGRPPFVGDSAESTRQLAALGKVADCFARLDACAAEPDLVALCKRCLSPDPADRPSDAGEVATAVAALRAAADDRARKAEIDREKAEVESREQRKRRRVVQWAGGITAAVLAVGVVGTAIGLFEAKKQEGIARGETTAKDTALKEEKRQRAKAEKAYAKTADVLDVMVSEIAGDSLATQKEISSEQMKFLAEILTYYQEFAAVEGSDEKTRVRMANAAFRVSHIEYRLGRVGESMAALRQAKDEYGKLATDFPDALDYRSNLARSHNNMGWLLAELGLQEEAEEQCRMGLALWQKLVAGFPTITTYRAGLALSHTNLGNLLAKFEKRSAAEEEYRKSLEIQEKLAADLSAAPKYRRELALSHSNYGALLLRQGKRAEAEEQLQKALNILAKLTAEATAVRTYWVDLGGCQLTLGSILGGDGGRPAESLVWFGKAIDTLRPINEVEPHDVRAKGHLRDSYWGRAAAYDQLKKHTNAVKDWDMVIQLSSTEEQPAFRAFRADSKVNSGQVTEAVAEVTELRRMSGWTPDFLYNFACVYSVASSKIAEEKQNHADRAMELLMKAVKAGYKDAAHMKQDTALAPLRDRDDFKKLLADLETKFPPKKEVLPAPRKG